MISGMDIRIEGVGIHRTPEAVVEGVGRCYAEAEVDRVEGVGNHYVEVGVDRGEEARGMASTADEVAERCTMDSQKVEEKSHASKGEEGWDKPEREAGTG